jgi:transcriptional regulator with XRE-family HTH domain
MDKLNVHLKEARKRTDLTLREVEDATGISNAYLSQLESGRIKKPSPTILFKLAGCYKIPYEHLLELAGHPVPQHPDGKALRPNFRLGDDLGNLTKEEEQKLQEYLEFLRSKKGR